MTTLSPEVRADLTLLRQQTAEVRRALAHTHRLGAERSATVLRLRNRGVTYRVIAAAMSSSIAAVQSILARAEQRVAPPTLGAGAGALGMSVGGTCAGGAGGAVGHTTTLEAQA